MIRVIGNGLRKLKKKRKKKIGKEHEVARFKVEWHESVIIKEPKGKPSP